MINLIRGIAMSNNQQMTLRDFKQWLAGVEEMQGEEWVPSKEQWGKIREKINNITDVGVHVAPQYPQTPQYPVPQFHQPVVPIHAVPGSSSLEGATQQPRPFVPPRLPPSMVTDPTGHGKAVTPNIDTSDGQYTSTFT